MPSTPLLSIPLVWLIAGVLLCLMELALPTAFVTFLMGISALIVAAIALIIPNLGLQVSLWLVLSTASIILSRRWLSVKPNKSLLKDSHEGETLTEISPGQAGRVLYEGNSWRAICEDETIAIAQKEKVYITRRQGNTLVVMPANLLH